jgi:putative peptide zinc metalloprotease protein
LVWFIGRPVYKELMVWKERRGEVTSRRRWALLGVLALLVLWLAFPFSSRVSGYGWTHAEEQQLVHAPFAAQLVQVPTQRQFKAGDVLFVLDSSMLSIAQDRSQQLAQAREAQIAGLMGLPDGEAQRQLLTSQKAFFEAEAKASVDELDRLTLRAPFDGELHDVDHGLAPGVWVKPREPLAMLIDPSRWVVDAYVAEQDLNRVRVGQAARIRLLAGPQTWVDGRVDAIDISRTTILPSAMLDATHGGPIATVNDTAHPGAEKSPVVRDALFRVRVALDAPLATRQSAPVRVRIEGEKESVLASVFRRMASILVRESGF